MYAVRRVDERFVFDAYRGISAHQTESEIQTAVVFDIFTVFVFLGLAVLTILLSFLVPAPVGYGARRGVEMYTDFVCGTGYYAYRRARVENARKIVFESDVQSDHLEYDVYHFKRYGDEQAVVVAEEYLDDTYEIFVRACVIESECLCPSRELFCECVCHAFGFGQRSGLSFGFFVATAETAEPIEQEVDVVNEDFTHSYRREVAVKLVLIIGKYDVELFSALLGVDFEAQLQIVDYAFESALDVDHTVDLEYQRVADVAEHYELRKSRHQAVVAEERIERVVVAEKTGYRAVFAQDFLIQSVKIERSAVYPYFDFDCSAQSKRIDFRRAHIVSRLR